MKLKMIRALLGHSTMEVTVNVYTHLLGAGKSIFSDYFIEYKRYLESRPTNILGKRWQEGSGALKIKRKLAKMQVFKQNLVHPQGLEPWTH